jgi:DNA-binding transcriptional LysR family regulator
LIARRLSNDFVRRSGKKNRWERVTALSSAAGSDCSDAGRNGPRLDDYLAVPHITVSFGDPGNNRVDQALAAIHRTRHIAITSHSFAGVLHCLAGTDLVATLPRRLVLALAKPDLHVFELPIVIAAYDYSILWHRRMDEDAGLTWMRKCLIDAVASKNIPNQTEKK